MVSSIGSASDAWPSNPFALANRENGKRSISSRGLNDLGTYDLKDETTKVDPAPIILIEGAYSASPRLRDLIDLAVLVSVPSRIRHDRIEHRERDSEDFLDDWHAVWDEVESLYFARVCPPASFDILVPNWR